MIKWVDGLKGTTWRSRNSRLWYQVSKNIVVTGRLPIWVFSIQLLTHLLSHERIISCLNYSDSCAQLRDTSVNRNKIKNQVYHGNQEWSTECLNTVLFGRLIYKVVITQSLCYYHRFWIVGIFTIMYVKE